MFKSIKSRFIILLLGFLLISVGIPVFFLISQFERNFHQRSEVMLETSLDMLMYGLNSAMMSEEKNIQHVVEKISLNSNVHHLSIFDKNGIIKFASDKSEIGENIFIARPFHVDSSVFTSEKRIVKYLRELKGYAAFEPILNKPDCSSCHGGDQVIAFIDVDTFLTPSEIDFFTGFRHMLFLGSAILIFLAGGLLFLFNGFINKPLQRLMGAMKKVAAGGLDQRLSVKGENEFSLLNSNFNFMVNEIKESRNKIEELHFAQLTHTDKLATLGEMTAQLAHEINNYIAIVMSRADFLLLESQKNPCLINYKDDLSAIQNEIERIAGVTTSVLRHSKKRKSNFNRIDLRNVLSQALKIFEPVIAKRSIKLNLRIDSKTTEILGDEIQMEQVITNLISNALDAIEDSGRIDIILNSKEDIITLKISDNGIGMNRDTIENIFSPFFTTKNDDKGTGLGLFIAKKICDDHKAEILCESEINHGTVFRINFNSLKDSK